LSAAVQPLTPQPWRRLARLPVAARVWLFSLLLTALGLATFLAVIVGLRVEAAVTFVPWWALAVAFYLAEVVVVHFQFRGQAHSFSLSEIPLVLGLFLLPPTEFIAATLVGSGLALVIARRQGPLKLAFNLSQFFLTATAALAVFHLVQLALPPGISSQWLAALAAAMTANVVGIVAVTGVIALVEGRFQGERLPQVIKFGVLVGFTNTCLALIAVTMLALEPMALWLLVLPGLLLYSAYRAYTSERQKHASLEFLYQATRILNGSREIDAAVIDLLSLTQRVFRAEQAEICFFSPDGTAHGFRAHPESAGPVTSFTLAANDPLWARAVAEGRPFFYRPESADQLAPHGLRNAMVALLQGETEPLGMFVVGNRLGEGGSFTDDDMLLFETLASQSETALENGQLGQSLRHLNELKEQLQHQAYHDPLTGLGNRALLVEELERAIAQSAVDGQPAILFIDMDDFKTINDSLGHAAGDELLKAVARRIGSILRPSELAVRLGGDEFAVLLRDADVRLARRVAERILAAMESPVAVIGQEVTCHLTIGVAIGAGGETSEELLRDADVAMYAAKASGKGRLAVFEPGMRVAVVERHALKADLQRALARSEFAICYQPIANLDTGEVIGLEALLRWHHPERGVVTPTDFIALAEESVLILAIGRWVLEQACRRAQAWNELRPGRPPLAIHVNLSPRQIQQPAFVDEVASVLAETGLDPSLLVLEITETRLMHDVQLNAARLRALKQLGVRIAIDDFGTGWSTLATLRDLPIDVLKMPKDFLEGRRAADADWKFARAIVGLGHSLRLEVIAEGIERSDQVRRLRQLGCDSGQGYLFAAPLDEAGVEDLLISEAAFAA
jgi:diguanylate cyclase (GGDEF)-like protein